MIVFYRVRLSGACIEIKLSEQGRTLIKLVVRQTIDMTSQRRQVRWHE